MNTTLAIILISSVVLLVVVWALFIEVSFVPMFLMLASLGVGLRYAIDRWGFGKIDTIKYLKEHADNGDLAPFITYMWQYTCIVVGAMLATVATFI